ncbi:DUF4394 domain-containing protein [Wenxinia marina]|uniref:DUF4394 domain-containing protein n=1 Tax=Wenxinia marina DSM 24838 TaxID=1123501 RepID=A0A0D0Q507_9RHOB|nr:DUF4394 domain-containing protein [Wenxinia marina]KIQ67602.1 hypothetical protein Wenmar_04028 [Wenxinia marina DSM 24838]GGL68156.1 hypothetical protein GCM10011392_23290 [Wenxinia marina]
MKAHLLTTAALLTTGATSALAEAHAGGAMGFALADDGATLVTMADIAAPGEVETVALSTSVRAIAYRPVTGDLLGFADGMIVSIDPATGEVTDLGATFAEDAAIGADGAVAFDFNNAIDAVRAVGSDGANLVYFPDGFGDGDERANQVMRFTDAAYGAGDANEGTSPMVFANAYTNAVSGATASETAQYALDAETDSLVTLANNDGTLGTVGPVTVDGAEADLSALGGFDILSMAEGENEGYAILQMEGAETAGLYMIDLQTGAATMLADLGMGGISGFAVAPAM